MVKNPPANAGDVGDIRHEFSPWVWKEEGMVTHSNILDWRIPWTEEPGGPGGLAESDTTEATLHIHVE